MRAVIATLIVAFSSCLAAGQESSRLLRAQRLVRELGEFPASIPATFRYDEQTREERRRAVYGELRVLGQEALSALAGGLADEDVRVRRGSALFLLMAGGGYGPDRRKIDIEPCLPSLIRAVSDSDARVRALSAQAIGEIGPSAAAAVPALIALLADPDEGSRNSACIGLRRIGPAARAALPALHHALSDPRPDVRRFAQQAIDAIER